MKKLITVIGLMFCLVATQAQNNVPITMNQQDSTLKTSIVYVFNQLKASHSEFSLGVHLEYCAATIGLFGGITSLALHNEPNRVGNTVWNVSLAFVGVFGIAGSICLIDSHKFISRMALTPVGLSITF